MQRKSKYLYCYLYNMKKERIIDKIIVLLFLFLAGVFYAHTTQIYARIKESIESVSVDMKGMSNAMGSTLKSMEKTSNEYQTLERNLEQSSYKECAEMNWVYIWEHLVYVLPVFNDERFETNFWPIRTHCINDKCFGYVYIKVVSYEQEWDCIKHINQMWWDGWFTSLEIAKLHAEEAIKNDKRCSFIGDC